MKTLSLSSMVMAVLVAASVFFSGSAASTTSEQSIRRANDAIELLELELRLAEKPLRVINAEGAPAASGNRIEFTRFGEQAMRAIEITADNKLLFDPNITIEGDESIVAQNVAASHRDGAFNAPGSASPLVIRLRVNTPNGNSI